jgi:hypothetical protein
MKFIIAGVVFAALGVSSAQAQSCPENFVTGGGRYHTYQLFPGLNPATALDNLARAGQASGFWVDVQVDRRAGVIRAENDGAGNGRTQAVVVSARRQGKGTRVDYAITLEPGQAPGNAFRLGICRYLRNASGG